MNEKAIFKKKKKKKCIYACVTTFFFHPIFYLFIIFNLRIACVTIIGNICDFCVVVFFILFPPQSQ